MLLRPSCEQSATVVEELRRSHPPTNLHARDVPCHKHWSPNKHELRLHQPPLGGGVTISSRLSLAPALKKEKVCLLSSLVSDFIASENCAKWLGTSTPACRHRHSHVFTTTTNLLSREPTIIVVGNKKDDHHNTHQCQLTTKKGGPQGPTA